MITDARVLQPEFVPNGVKHRAAEVSHLSDTLRPIMYGQRAETSLLYGSSGAGKTCIAQHTIEQLRENVVALNYQYVNCWRNYTRFRTLYQILETLGVEASLKVSLVDEERISATYTSGSVRESLQRIWK